MIVRAAAADALVLVPRGDGELPAGRARPLPAALTRSAACSCSSATRRRRRSHREQPGTDELPDRPARRPFLRATGTGAYRASGERDELAGDAEPGEEEDDERHGDVADRDERRRGTSRVSQPRPQPLRQRPDEERRPGEPRGQQRRPCPDRAATGTAVARATRGATAGRRRARRRSPRRRGATSSAQHQQRGRVAGQLLLERDLRGAGAAAAARRSTQREDASTSAPIASTGHVWAGGSLRRDRTRVALRPAAEPRRRRRRAQPHEEPEREPAAVAPQRPARAVCAAAGNARTGRPRPRGTGAAPRRARAATAQPAHDARARGRGRALAPGVVVSPWSSERRAPCAARPSCPDARRLERVAGAPRCRARPGRRSPCVVIVTRGHVRPTNGACS